MLETLIFADVKFGCFLKKQGINNYAFSLRNLSEVLKIIDKEKVIILGGDILRLKEHKYEYTYDNWSVSNNIDESYDDFRIRSVQESFNYLEKLDKSLFFTVTIANYSNWISLNKASKKGL